MEDPAPTCEVHGLYIDRDVDAINDGGEEEVRLEEILRPVLADE